MSERRDEPVKVTRIRRPWTWRRIVRPILFLVGLAAGVEIAHLLAPDAVGISLDLILARGLFLGTVLGAVLMSLASEPDRSLGPRLPERFGHSLEDWMTELDADEPQSE